MNRRLLAILMAVLTAALCCSVGLADSGKDDSDAILAWFKFGVYNGYDYSIDVRNSSSALIKEIGTYGTNANIRLKFIPYFSYYADDGSLVTLTGYSPVMITYGPSYTTSLTKSYTVSQAASALNLSGVINSSVYSFSRCIYKLNISSTDVTSLDITYMS